MTLRLQIATAFGVLAAVCAITAAFFSYTSIKERLQVETSEFLDDRIEQVMIVSNARIQLMGSDDPRLSELDPAVAAPFVRYDSVIQFFQPDGELVFAVSDVALPVTQTELDEAMASGQPISSRKDAAGRTYETRRVRFAAQEGRNVVLQVGSDITGQLEALEQLRMRLGVLAAAVLAVAAVMGYFLAGRLVHPLEDLRTATRVIADTKDFSRSVPVQGTGEIADVATDFNLMLSALADSVLQQRRLVQDAGHELRTPLSTLRASLELSQRITTKNQVSGTDVSHPHSDQVELLSTAVGEVDELSRLVDELVNLAAFPFDETPVEQLNLEDVVDSAVKAFEQKHPNRRIVVDVGQNLPVQGKHTHLVRAVANVLANADKFAPDDTTIEVSAAANRIIVSDRGPGIPPNELDRVFDRFYRSPTVQTIEGSGLGLALVAEIVGAHQGSAQASNRAGGGATITLNMPAAMNRPAAKPSPT